MNNYFKTLKLTQTVSLSKNRKGWYQLELKYSFDYSNLNNNIILRKLAEVQLLSQNEQQGYQKYFDVFVVLPGCSWLQVNLISFCLYNTFYTLKEREV